MPEDVSTRDSDRWRDRLLSATIDRRLGDLDRRVLEHRFDTANRPARRDAVRGEIELILRFLAIGATVGTEASDPEGSPIDLRVTLDDTTFAVHVKRLATAPPAPGPIPAALQEFVDVPRPYIVGIDWRGGAVNPADLEDLREFLLSARLGDRCLLRDADDQPAGSAKILAPSPDVESGVLLRPMGDPPAESAWVERAGRHLRRAYRQFAGGRENVIALVGGGPAAGDLVDLAVLGGHVERWDRLPRIGQRVAHGRDDRGLWTGRRYDRSRLVAWCPIGGRGRVWSREPAGPPAAVEAAVAKATAELTGDAD